MGGLFTFVHVNSQRDYGHVALTFSVLYPAAAYSTKFCDVVASTSTSGRQQSLFTRRRCCNVRVTEKGYSTSKEKLKIVFPPGMTAGLHTQLRPF